MRHHSQNRISILNLNIYASSFLLLDAAKFELFFLSVNSRWQFGSLRLTLIYPLIDVTGHIDSYSIESAFGWCDAEFKLTNVASLCILGLIRTTCLHLVLTTCSCSPTTVSSSCFYFVVPFEKTSGCNSAPQVVDLSLTVSPCLKRGIISRLLIP